MIFRRLFLCWWGGCGMVQRDDATHVWGECLRCGKRAGVISRADIRRYIEAEVARQWGHKQITGYVIVSKDADPWSVKVFETPAAAQYYLLSDPEVAAMNPIERTRTFKIRAIDCSPPLPAAQP